MSGWPALAQGIAQFADDMFGLYARNTADRRAGEIAHAENKQAVMGRVEAAKALGLHPTAVLGGSFGGSGPGAGFQSNFSDFAANLVNQNTQQRQWKQEMGMRQLTEKRLATDMVNNAKLTNAQVKHIEKQSSWIDEQIKASQEQRLREASKHQKAATGPSGDGMLMSGPNGLMTKYIPHEVTRHKGGVAQGVNPGVEEYMDQDGVIRRRPHGVQTESSEAMNMIRDFSAETGIPMSEILGQPGFWKKVYDRFGPPAYRGPLFKGRRYRKFVPARSGGGGR